MPKASSHFCVKRPLLSMPEVNGDHSGKQEHRERRKGHRRHHERHHKRKEHKRHKKKEHHKQRLEQQERRGAEGACPVGWSGPKVAGCCIRRWSTRCDLPCSVQDCKANGWDFRWADFRSHPYICCPKEPLNASFQLLEVVRHQYLGGQEICPSGPGPEKGPEKARKA